MRTRILLLIAVSVSAVAQQPAPVSLVSQTGQVTGHVVCGDTNQPARFATVQLIGEHPAAATVFDYGALAKEADPEKAIGKAMAAVMKGGNSNLSAVTALDGAFLMDKVPPGIYWVVGQFPGYLSPLSQLSMMERSQATADAFKTVQSSAEKIEVQPNVSVKVDIRLERGASISGTVRYDDGSPAPGVNPMLMSLDKDGKWKDLGSVSATPASTDDEGRYRLYGLLPGKYAVKASLPTTQIAVGLGAMPSIHSSMGDMLMVYSGGALHEKDVKPVEVGSGDNVGGVDVVFPIDNLHTISGFVVAKTDSHAVNAGWVSLEDSDTKTQVRGTEIEQDGSFRLNYVLEGQYILKVGGAADTEKSGDDASGSFPAFMVHNKTLKGYGPVEMAITLKNDSTGLVLQVPDISAAPSQSPAAVPPTAAP
jgi:hypothetical protein